MPLVSLLAACLLPGDDSVAPPKKQWFEPPVRLQADGKVIDHGAAWGHCGPTLHDMDGDGVDDLVVGDFGGKFTVYRNVGTAEKPEFGAGVLLQADRADAKVPVY